VPTLLDNTWLDGHSDGLAIFTRFMTGLLKPKNRILGVDLAGDVGSAPILAIIAAIGLLLTGKYSKDIFNLVVGMNRWSYRVYAYTSLMTSKYPPFRLWDD